MCFSRTGSIISILESATLDHAENNVVLLFLNVRLALARLLRSQIRFIGLDYAREHSGLYSSLADAVAEEPGRLGVVLFYAKMSPHLQRADSLFRFEDK